jgi:hypothetical protein
VRRISKQVLEWQEGALIESAHKHLLRALELRFGGPVPAALASAVAELADLAELSRWFDVSQMAGSLAEFRAAVGVE